MKTAVNQALFNRCIVADSLSLIGCKGWGWLLAAILCVLWFPGLLQGQTSDTNLVLRFDFEQNNANGRVQDVSGRGNDGWQFNQTNLLGFTNGVFGSTAARFRYVGFISNDFPSIYAFSQYIAVTNVAGFEYLTNGTISVWARFDTNNDVGMYLLDSGYSVAYAADHSASSNAWTLGRYITPYLCLVAYPADGSAQTIVTWPNDTVRSGGSNPDLSTTSFHLYTVTIDCPGNRAVSYYDGVPYMTNAIFLPWLRIYGCSSMRWLCVGAMAHDGTPFWGDDYYPNAGYFVGKLDDVRIYNRTLSASEVQALYFGAGTGAFSRNASVRPVSSSLLQLAFDGRSNTTYQVEWRADLVSGVWQPLGTPILSAGTTSSINDSFTGQGQRFYRVRPLP